MLSPSVWLSLPQETRRLLREVLKIPKSGGVEVAGNRVVSDGTTLQDLSSVTLLKLQDALGSADGDFYKLFHQLVVKVTPKPIIVEAIAPVKVLTTENLVETLNDLINKPKFCDGCNSKGVRHKKDCTKKLN